MQKAKIHQMQKQEGKECKNAYKVFRSCKCVAAAGKRRPLHLPIALSPYPAAAFSIFSATIKIADRTDPG
jgi:hypothetical protein